MTHRPKAIGGDRSDAAGALLAMATSLHACEGMSDAEAVMTVVDLR